MKRKNSKLLVAIFCCVILMLITAGIAFAANIVSLESRRAAENYYDNVLSIENPDHVVGSVNSESIYLKELMFEKWRNESATAAGYVSEETDSTILLREIAKKKIVLVLAKENDCALSTSEADAINKLMIEGYERNAEENEEIAQLMGISKEELVNLLTNDAIFINTNAKLAATVVPKLISGDFAIDTSKLKSIKDKIIEYRSKNNIEGALKEAASLYDEFINHSLNMMEFKIT